MAEDWGAGPDRPEDAERLPALVDAVGGMLDLIEDRFEYITHKRTTELWPFHFAAAGLARCIALLRAMCLIAVGRRDTLGTLTRPLFESWLVALYCHYGGPAALDQLTRAHKRALRVINETRKLGFDELVAEWKLEEREFIVSNILTFVDERIRAEAVEAGEEEPEPVAQIAYDHLFRSESLMEVHAGIGTFRRYVGVDLRRPYADIVSRPKPAHPPTRILLASAQMVAVLAQKVFKAVGLRHEPIATALSSVEAVLPPHPMAAEIEEQRKAKRRETRERERLVRLLRIRVEQLAQGPVVARALLRSGRIRKGLRLPGYLGVRRTLREGAMAEEPDYTELIEEYKKTGEFPLIWQWTARDMICAANVLHRKREAIQEKRAEAASELRFHTTPAPIMLLYGLGLEILLKGLLVAQGVSATSTGELNDKLKTHNLLHLWREAGLPVDEQRDDLLRRLHWSVESGKYPVGTKPDPKYSSL